MALVTGWSLFFQSNARMRGRALHLANAVTLVEPEHEELVRAHVREIPADSDREDVPQNGAPVTTDSEPEIVTLREEDRVACAECTCDIFQGGKYCPHIWATLLHIQQNKSSLGASPEALTKLRVRPPKARRRKVARVSVRQQEAEWMQRLTLLRPVSSEVDPASRFASVEGSLAYVVLADTSNRSGHLVLEVRLRDPGQSDWSRAKPFRLSHTGIQRLPNERDRKLCSWLLGSMGMLDLDLDRVSHGDRQAGVFRLPVGIRHSILDAMIQTQRCFVDYEEPERVQLIRLEKDAGAPWKLWLVGDQEEDALRTRLVLRRDADELAIDAPSVLLGGQSTADGLLIHEHTVHVLEDAEAIQWAQHFREHCDAEGHVKPMRVEKADWPGFLKRLYMMANLPEVELPEGFGPHERHDPPVIELELTARSGKKEGNSDTNSSSRTTVDAQVWLHYADQRVNPCAQGRFVTLNHALAAEAASEQAEASGETLPEHTIIRRDPAIEARAIQRLGSLGLRRSANGGGNNFTLSAAQIPEVVAQLLQEGWRVNADQKLVKQAKIPAVSISSGMDWFDLQANLTFEREDGTIQEVSLPEVLAAVKSGKRMIELGDGTQGLLPQHWLEQHELLATLGKVRGSAVRFRKNQAALLDALLDEQQVQADDAFVQVRDKLRAFDGIPPLEPSKVFQGSLRPYQCDGLGWMAFLRMFYFGGVLADDMGLGKTIQMLAMLQARKLGLPGYIDESEQPYKPLPTLIISPRSLIFNWVDEATRFTPELKVLTYSGQDRDTLRDQFMSHDLVVTSYGLMRRDIEALREQQFDYVVLDEAQAIKNPQSQAAKAARLIDARHRLALTGTPVENHLGDLWSIFEFLNPGMLGTHLRFAELVRAGRSSDQSPEADHNVQQISRVLRPFILRRTKRQVLHDLPAKTEQTILCDMEPAQQKVYDELKLYYRNTLMKQMDDGTAPANGKSGFSSFMVLEALLRLRQAACHPGLIDDKRSNESAAKLDTLFEMLDEVIDEGGKALVFSQFTSMLGIVKQHLDARGIKYCYLDGQTQDRRAVVDRFQQDSNIPLFLISLKAGGFGLNLTAAEYVFILDPWWNPAVEAQAIDRTHRIGQTRPVFAYRLVCRDTVEERILALQDRKRDLANAIVGGDNSVLKQLTRDDLEALLS